MDRKQVWLSKIKESGALQGNRLVLPKGVKIMSFSFADKSGCQLGQYDKHELSVDGEFIRSTSKGNGQIISEYWWLIEDMTQFHLFIGT